SADLPLPSLALPTRGPGSVDTEVASLGSSGTDAPPPSARASNRSASQRRALPNRPWDATCTSSAGRRCPQCRPGLAFSALVCRVGSAHARGATTSPSWSLHSGRLHATVSVDRNDLGRTKAGGVGRPVIGHPLRLPLGCHPHGIVPELALDLLRRPPEYGRDQPRDLLRTPLAPIERLDRYVGTPGEDIIEMAHSLVRRRVDDLRSQIV